MILLATDRPISLLYAAGTFATDETRIGFWDRHTTRASRLPEETQHLWSSPRIGFQKKLKTGAVLIDLSAAYDTV